MSEFGVAGVERGQAYARLCCTSRRSLRHSYPVSGFDASTYGDSFADVYDQWYGDPAEADATATFISTFGPAQRILELGTGTGLVAAALADAGHRVTGLDASMKMLHRFHADAEVVGADMAQPPFTDAAFDTVLIATNTFFNLTTAATQQHCMESARRILRLGGRLVIEAYVPADSDPASDRLVTTRSVAIDEVVLTASIRDEVSQTVIGQHVQITESGIRLRPWKIRYATPDELDAMASAAGFRLGARIENWSTETFDASSSGHVSVYIAI